MTNRKMRMVLLAAVGVLFIQFSQAQVLSLQAPHASAGGNFLLSGR